MLYAPFYRRTKINPNAQQEQIKSYTELKNHPEINPEIRAWPARTECHCSTTCATTAAVPVDILDSVDILDM